MRRASLHISSYSHKLQKSPYNSRNNEFQADDSIKKVSIYRDKKYLKIF